MRQLLLAVGLVSLVACPKPPADEVPQPPAVDADPSSASVTRPAGCDSGPGWLGLSPCTYGGAVFAVGEMSGESSLARAGAMNRARAHLVELGLGQPQPDGAVRLEGSEGWDSFSCGGQSYALVRRAHDGPGVTPWPACPATVIDNAAVGDCPAWTRRSAWREGQTIVAVGAVQGSKNPALALSTAKNRALVEAQKLVAVSLTINEAGVTARSVGGAAGVPGGVETATCGDTLFAKVTVNAR